MITQKEVYMGKKGQASMEFLMTYGWAILAAVLAIGVLAYYGVFSPGKSLPNICTLSAPLGCDEYQVNATHATIVIVNGGGDAITISNFDVAGCTANATSIGLADGGLMTYELPCAGLTAGQKFSGNVAITYLRAGKTITQQSTGSLRAQVV